MRTTSRNKSAFLVACAVAGLAACSNNDMAGVISETESGQQVAGIVIDTDGNVIANAELVIVSSDNVAARKLPLATATTQENGSFKAFVAESNGNVFAKTKNGLSAVQSFDANGDSLILELAESAILEIKPYTYNLRAGDTICLVGTPYCESVTTSEIDEVVKFNIPAMHLDSMELLGNFAPKTVDLQLELLPGDSLQINMFSKSENDIYKLNIPDDALTQYTLPDFILPLNAEATEQCVGISTGEESCWISTKEDDLRYATMPYLTLDSSELHYVYAPRANDLNDKIAEPSNIVYDNLGKIIFSDDSKIHEYSWEAFTNKSKSAYIMFWLKLDSETLSDTGFTFIDFDAKTAGMKIRQCGSDKRTMCVRVLSGIEGISVDTTEYGSAKIMDGKWHFYAVSIYDKHLSIFADGKMIRNTDIKIAPEFYEATIGMSAKWLPFKSEKQGEIRGFVKGEFRENILINDPKKKWEKLAAWFNAEYHLFKQYYDFQEN